MLRSSISRILVPTTLIALATAAAGCGESDSGLLEVAPVIVVPGSEGTKAAPGPPSAANASLAADRATHQRGKK